MRSFSHHNTESIMMIFGRVVIINVVCTLGQSYIKPLESLLVAKCRITCQEAIWWYPFGGIKQIMIDDQI